MRMDSLEFQHLELLAAGDGGGVGGEGLGGEGVCARVWAKGCVCACVGVCGRKGLGFRV